MAGLGEDLRLERLKRKVSLADMSAETKVTVRHFEALEQGEYHALPGGVFRRGILRAYLRSLHLEEDSWMPRFEADLDAQARARGEATGPDDAAWAEFAENVKKNRVRSAPRNGWRWAGVLALLLCLVVAAWALWSYELRHLLT